MMLALTRFVPPPIGGTRGGDAARSYCQHRKIRRGLLCGRSRAAHAYRPRSAVGLPTPSTHIASNIDEHIPKIVEEKLQRLIRGPTFGYTSKVQPRSQREAYAPPAPIELNAPPSAGKGGAIGNSPLHHHISERFTVSDDLEIGR